MSLVVSEIAKESSRLYGWLKHVKSVDHHPWLQEQCDRMAPLTLEINQLKRDKNAIILAHSYVLSQIVYGVADFKSDSYALALEARNSGAEMIIFAGVVFMGETAKIVCPEAKVYMPDMLAGCSLADALSADQLRDLKRQHPEAAVVCYINSTAEVKAESDVCVTSSNVYTIIEKLPQQQILFVPDQLMADNIRIEMKRRNIDKEIISSDGRCEVHELFDRSIIEHERAAHPGVKVISHPECNTEITQNSDFVGSTGAMMRYVEDSDASSFMMLTECGLVGRLQAENPSKQFVGTCRLCPYMKLNTLEKIKQILIAPREDQLIEVDETIAVAARRSIDRMFELS
jgi:quinolinate synthase